MLVISYLRRSAAHMETDFTSLRLNPKTLLDGYEELEKTKQEFKDNVDLMRKRVWKHVEEIDRLKGGLEKKENALTDREKGKPSWRQNKK